MGFYDGDVGRSLEVVLLGIFWYFEILEGFGGW